MANGQILIVGGSIAGSVGNIYAGVDAATQKILQAGTATEIYDVTLNGGTGGSVGTNNSGVITTSSVFATEGRASGFLLPLANGKFLYFGGNGSFTGTYSPTAEVYDSSTGTFTATGSTATQRANSAAAIMGNGDVLLVGGTNADAVTEIYRPQ